MRYITLTRYADCSRNANLRRRMGIASVGLPLLTWYVSANLR